MCIFGAFVICEGDPSQSQVAKNYFINSDTVYCQLDSLRTWCCFSFFYQSNWSRGTFISRSIHSENTRMQLSFLIVPLATVAFVMSSPLVEREFCSTVVAGEPCDKSKEQPCCVNSFNVATCITDTPFSSKGSWRIDPCGKGQVCKNWQYGGG